MVYDIVAAVCALSNVTVTRFLSSEDYCSHSSRGVK